MVCVKLSKEATAAVLVGLSPSAEQEDIDVVTGLAFIFEHNRRLLVILPKRDSAMKPPKYYSFLAVKITNLFAKSDIT